MIFMIRIFIFKVFRLLKYTTFYLFWLGIKAIGSEDRVMRNPYCLRYFDQDKCSCGAYD